MDQLLHWFVKGITIFKGVGLYQERDCFIEILNLWLDFWVRWLDGNPFSLLLYDAGDISLIVQLWSGFHRVLALCQFLDWIYWDIEISPYVDRFV